jgi:hypothetical protein
MNLNAYCPRLLSLSDNTDTSRNSRDCPDTPVYDISKNNVGAVVLPGLVVDKTTHPGYGVCTWPFKVGTKIRSMYWDGSNPSDYYKVLKYEGDRVFLVQHGIEYLQDYSKSAFGDLNDWYYSSPLERQKTGFGKFVSRIESS